MIEYKGPSVISLSSIFPSIFPQEQFALVNFSLLCPKEFFLSASEKVLSVSEWG